MSEQSRREKLAVLLENYIDVVNGLRDKTGDGVHLPLMCRAYNHSSYQQLERLVVQMRFTEPRLFTELHNRYLDVMQTQRRMKACQVATCSFKVDIWSSVHFHKHRTKRGNESIPLVPKMVRLYRRLPDEERLAEAVVWLDEHWEGGVFLPDELMRKDREAA